MHATLLGKIALLPVFLLVAALLAGWGAWVFALALALTGAGYFAFTRLRRDPVIFAITAAAAVAVWGLQTWDPSPRLGMTMLLAMLGGGMAVGVALRRPWTAALSAGQAAADHPLFIAINSAISAMWAAIFALNAGLVFLAVPQWVATVMVVAGIAVSILLPPAWVRRHLARRLAARDPYPWSLPEFGRGDADADVIVIGAGLGGLSAAALLADAGLRVVVCEQHALAGGFAHHWLRRAPQEPGRPVFRFDGGVHDFSGVQAGGPVHALLTCLGLNGAIEWLPVRHARVSDGLYRPLPSQWEAFVADLTARFPNESERLRGALADIRTLFFSMYAGATERGGFPGAPASVAAMLEYARRHPLATRWLERPFAEFIAAHALSPAAGAALLDLASYVSDDPASLTVAQMVLIFGYRVHGGFYPRGGSGQLASALVQAIRGRGGEVRLRTAVGEVLVEDGAVVGVRLAKGEILRAPAVVMNADFLHACRSLVATECWPPEFARRLAATVPACSAFTLHLAVRGNYPDVAPVIHVEHAGEQLGIVLPSRIDAGAAPAGYCTVEITRLLNAAEAAAWFAMPSGVEVDAWRASPEYLAKKRHMGDAMIALAATALPGLAERIVLREEASPLTFRRYDWSTQGSIYGCVGAARGLAPKSPLRGLVFAGAVTHGPGVEAVVISGAEAAAALCPGILQAAPLRVSPALLQPA